MNNNTNQPSQNDRREPDPAAMLRRLQAYFGASDALEEGARFDGETREAFAAYLLCVYDSEPASQDLLEEFDERYFGTYDAWDRTRETLLLSLQWQGTLEGIKSSTGEKIGDYLAWNDSALRARLSRSFWIIEIDEHFHVFRRASAQVD